MNTNIKNILAALIILAIVYFMAVSFNVYDLSLENFKPTELNRDQIEIFSKFCMFSLIAFYIDFKNNNNGNTKTR